MLFGDVRMSGERQEAGPVPMSRMRSLGRGVIVSIAMRRWSTIAPDTTQTCPMPGSERESGSA